MVGRQDFDNDADFSEFQKLLDQRMREENVKQFDEMIKKHTARTMAHFDAEIIIQQKLEEAKVANLEILAGNKAKEVTTRQGQFLTEIIKDINLYGGKNSAMRQAYVAEKHGKEVAPGINSNHCLIVQIAALNKANNELGPQISEQLSKFNTELEQANILQIKTNRQRNVGDPIHVGVADTLGLGSNFRIRDFMNKFGNSEYMDNVDVNSQVEKTGYADFKGKDGSTQSYTTSLEDKTITLGNYVDKNGFVKKDEQGNPLLKDGDFAFVQTSHDNANSSGFHAIRLNVAEDGKVTYTAGNNERINNELGSYYTNASCAIFHTQDYVTDCIKEQYKNLNRNQIEILTAEAYPDQVVTVDREAIFQECYDKKLQKMMSENQERKQEAITTANARELTPAEKLRALQMGKTVTQASQTPISAAHVNTQVHQGFNTAAFQRIQALRSKINS